MFCFALFLISCNDDKECCVLPDTECFSFDVRQCQSDEFAEQVPENESIEMRENLMLSFLSEKGFAVQQVKLVENFHLAVCEACDICPMGARYFINVNVQSNNLTLGEELRLLSFESDDCSVFE